MAALNKYLIRKWLFTFFLLLLRTLLRVVRARVHGAPAPLLLDGVRLRSTELVFLLDPSKCRRSRLSLLSLEASSRPSGARRLRRFCCRISAEKFINA